MDWKDANKVKVINDGFYWVLFGSGQISMLILYKYPSFQCWQDRQGNDIDIQDTKYIEIIKPKPPIEVNVIQGIIDQKVSD